MIPRLDNLWTLNLKELLGSSDSNQHKNKLLDDPCSKHSDTMQILHCIRLNSIAFVHHTLHV